MQMQQQALSDQRSGMPSQQIIEEKFKKSTGEIGYKRYIKGKYLGKGGFAKCYEFINAETKQVHASKII